MTPAAMPAFMRLLSVPSICLLDTNAAVALGMVTTSGCLQVGHFACRPANSSFTLSFMPQVEQEKAIMGASWLKEKRANQRRKRLPNLTLKIGEARKCPSLTVLQHSINQLESF